MRLGTFDIKKCAHVPFPKFLIQVKLDMNVKDDGVVAVSQVEVKFADNSTLLVAPF